MSGKETSVRRTPLARPESCTGTLEVQEHRHDFHLVLERFQVCGRRLDYWNMDGRQLRGRGGGVNGPAVVAFWWDHLNMICPPGEDDEVHCLLARAHLRFAHCHAIHQVYNAVHLGRCADRGYALPPKRPSDCWRN